LGRRLRDLASAALDVSDGLIADLGHIAEVSGVGIVIDAERVPLSRAFATLWGKGTQAGLRAATAGDDYEIAFTAPPSARPAIAQAAQETGVPVHEIGHVRDGTGVELRDEKGVPMPVPRPGYTHF
jgi:thiamine-monophosphate kinase